MTLARLRLLVKFAHKTGTRGTGPAPHDQFADCYLPSRPEIVSNWEQKSRSIRVYISNNGNEEKALNGGGKSNRCQHSQGDAEAKTDGVSSQ
jgi:hypothetical protein